jgi:hypothetical protein
MWSTFGCTANRNEISVSRTLHSLADYSSFKLAKKWNTLKCSWIDEWLKKMQLLYTMEYYTAYKKKEILQLMTI